MVDPTVTTEADTYIIPAFPVVTYRFFTVLSHQGELDLKEAEQQRTDAFELWCWRNTPESPLDSKESKPVNLQGDQPRIFTGRTDVEAEAPIL